MPDDSPFKLRYLSSFWVDYRNVIEYLSIIGSVWTAQRFISTLKKKTKTLEMFPDGYPKRMLHHQYRRFIVMGYVVFCRPPTLLDLRKLTIK